MIEWLCFIKKMEKILPKNNADLRLSAQRALLDHIPPCLRAVSLEYKEGKIIFRIVYDRKPSTAEKELLSMAGTEIVSDFPDISEFVEEHLEIHMPEKIPHLENLVYQRNETNYD